MLNFHIIWCNNYRLGGEGNLDSIGQKLVQKWCLAFPNRFCNASLLAEGTLGYTISFSAILKSLVLSQDKWTVGGAQGSQKSAVSQNVSSSPFPCLLNSKGGHLISSLYPAPVSKLLQPFNLFYLVCFEVFIGFVRHTGNSLTLCFRPPLPPTTNYSI